MARLLPLLLVLFFLLVLLLGLFVLRFLRARTHSHAPGTDPCLSRRAMPTAASEHAHPCTAAQHPHSSDATARARMTTAPTLARTGLRAHTNSGTLLPCGADALTSSSSSPSSSSSSSSPPSSSSSSSSSSSVFRFFSAQGRSTRRVTYWRTRAAAYRAALVRPASTSAVGAAAAAGWHGHWPCGGRRGRRAGGDYALSSSSSSALRLLTGHAAVSDVNAACAREKREAWGWGLAHALELLRHGAVLCRRQVRAGASPVVLGGLTKTHTNSDPKLSGISPDFRKFLEKFVFTAHCFKYLVQKYVSFTEMPKPVRPRSPRLTFRTDIPAEENTFSKREGDVW